MKAFVWLVIIYVLCGASATEDVQNATLSTSTSPLVTTVPTTQSQAATDPPPSRRTDKGSGPRENYEYDYHDDDDGTNDSHNYDNYNVYRSELPHKHKDDISRDYYYDRSRHTTFSGGPAVQTILENVRKIKKNNDCQTYNRNLLSLWKAFSQYQNITPDVETLHNLATVLFAFVELKSKKNRYRNRVAVADSAIDEIVRAIEIHLKLVKNNAVSYPDIVRIISNHLYPYCKNGKSSNFQNIVADIFYEYQINSEDCNLKPIRNTGREKNSKNKSKKDINKYFSQGDQDFRDDLLEQLVKSSSKAKERRKPKSVKVSKNSCIDLAFTNFLANLSKAIRDFTKSTECKRRPRALLIGDPRDQYDEIQENSQYTTVYEDKNDIHEKITTHLNMKEDAGADEDQLATKFLPKLFVTTGTHVPLKPLVSAKVKERSDVNKEKEKKLTILDYLFRLPGYLSRLKENRERNKYKSPYDLFHKPMNSHVQSSVEYDEEAFNLLTDFMRRVPDPRRNKFSELIKLLLAKTREQDNGKYPKFTPKHSTLNDYELETTNDVFRSSKPEKNERFSKWRLRESGISNERHFQHSYRKENNSVPRTSAAKIKKIPVVKLSTYVDGIHSTEDYEITYLLRRPKYIVYQPEVVVKQKVDRNMFTQLYKNLNNLSKSGEMQLLQIVKKSNKTGDEIIYAVEDVVSTVKINNPYPAETTLKYIEEVRTKYPRLIFDYSLQTAAETKNRSTHTTKNPEENSHESSKHLTQIDIAEKASSRPSDEVLSEREHYEAIGKLRSLQNMNSGWYDDDIDQKSLLVLPAVKFARTSSQFQDIVDSFKPVEE